ncbi:MAG: AAA family ATPase [Dehalococcoidia bacterium]
MAEPFLLQMAGVPGSGKSALARLIGRCTGAVVIDKDVLNTAVLDVGVAEQHAGETAYEAFFALADHMLGQGLSVILDSPSFWESIPTRGSAIAAQREVPYYFIQCLCADDIEIARRRRERPRLASQPDEPVLGEAQTIAPSGAYLQIDTTQPIERCLARALDYLGASDLAP